ncbi:hypothetical protein NT6N_01130 [Oceaniferula spumae]|uniref:Glycosyl hydrolases family 39 N-terminal catalytic domain-containing protein n=1 Tax=Oceaniferula spumae TaxID=2979115 RepID=A0AAT9FGI4_9BACT
MNFKASTHTFSKNFFRLASQLSLVIPMMSVSSIFAAEEATVSVQTDKVIATTSDNRLLGSNLGLWYEPNELTALSSSPWFKSWKPGLLRMPGGSWSDEYFWNGNGVRFGNKFPTKKPGPEGWKIDFSKFKPGFRVFHDKSIHDFNGHIDVQQLHEFINATGSETMVTVNLGTGTPELAAAWVRWANNEMGYKVKYWEVGNELEGSWEAGHIRPDGSKMTAKKYADLYVKFAKAMKAVDPTIKVGGPTNSNDSIVYVDELIETAGDHIDFISFHTYPVDGKMTEPRAVLNESARVGKAVSHIREMLAKHQPKRAKDIEIGITEWHVKVHEDDLTCNLVSGLWSARFIGEMFLNKVDFANQWDMFSTTEHGGHGLFNKGGAPLSARASYWAMWLWSNQMGDKLVESSIEGSKDLVVYATLRDGQPAIMLINQSPDEKLTVSMDIDEEEWKSAHLVEFSHKNYLWNPYSQKPEWSQSPRVRKLDSINVLGALTLAPLSATVVRVNADLKPSDAKQGKATPDIFLPKTHPADMPLTATVLLRDAEKSGPYLGSPAELKITVEGPLTLSDSSLLMHNAVANMILTPTGAGKATIRLESQGQVTTRSLTMVKTKNTDHTIWTFANAAAVKEVNSQLDAKHNPNERRNEDVMEIAFNQARPEKGKDLAVNINSPKLPFENKQIGGVFLKLKIDEELAKAPKGAAVQVVIQSSADHWMVIDEIPITSLDDTWQDRRKVLVKPEHLKAMSEFYAVVLKIKSPKPLNGKLYIDDLGLIQRH